MIAINVKELLSKEVGYKIEDKFEILFEIEEVDLIDPVEIKYKIIKLQEGLIGHFYVRFTAKLECSRCLEQFAFVVEKEFDRQFSLTPLEEELPITSYKIDIQKPLREEIILSLPIKNLCKEACKGLCLGCGKDLNIKDCTCHRLT